jgi:hypothetical protein
MALTHTSSPSMPTIAEIFTGCSILLPVWSISQ